MKKTFVALLVVVCFATFAIAQQSLPEDIVLKIKQEALQNSQIESLAFYLTDYAGPRLVASKLCERAELLAKEKLVELGFSNPRIEKAADFPRGGWDNLKTYAAMTAPYYCNFAATPKAYSSGTDGVVRGEVVLLDINTMEDLERLRGTLRDKIVLRPETEKYEMWFEPFATRLSDSILSELSVAETSEPVTPPPPASGTPGTKPSYRLIWDMLYKDPPAVIINGNGLFNVPRSTYSVALSGGRSSVGTNPWAELELPVEAHGRMVRLISQNIPVSMEVEVTNEFNDNTVVNNIFAEIPGTDPALKDQIVLIGAHLDSQHGGTGAADNAAGCMVMIEALRLIKETAIQPRRTIRLALWGGEESGMVGSAGYMRANLYDEEQNRPREGYDLFALYLNSDYGSGRFRGIYLDQNDKAVPFFQEWIKPLAFDEFAVLSPRGRAGSDHRVFDGIGLPAFYFIQDPLDFMHSLHTIMDTYERLVFTDLQYNAIVVAVLALSAAMDDGKIPPKPL